MRRATLKLLQGKVLISLCTTYLSYFEEVEALMDWHVVFVHSMFIPMD